MKAFSIYQTFTLLFLATFGIQCALGAPEKGRVAPLGSNEPLAIGDTITFTFEPFNKDLAETYHKDKQLKVYLSTRKWTGFARLREFKDVEVSKNDDGTYTVNAVIPEKAKGKYRIVVKRPSRYFRRMWRSKVAYSKYKITVDPKKAKTPTVVTTGPIAEPAASDEAAAASAEGTEAGAGSEGETEVTTREPATPAAGGATA